VANSDLVQPFACIVQCVKAEVLNLDWLEVVVAEPDINSQIVYRLQAGVDFAAVQGAYHVRKDTAHKDGVQVWDDTIYKDACTMLTYFLAMLS